MLVKNSNEQVKEMEIRRKGDLLSQNKSENPKELENIETILGRTN